MGVKTISLVLCATFVAFVETAQISEADLLGLPKQEVDNDSERLFEYVKTTSEGIRLGCKGKVRKGTPDTPGIDGIDGPAGLAGPDGLAGLPGPDGLPGIPGLAGNNGFSGVTGLDGQHGMSGLEGLQGKCCSGTGGWSVEGSGWGPDAEGCPADLGLSADDEHE